MTRLFGSLLCAMLLAAPVAAQQTLVPLTTPIIIATATQWAVTAFNVDNLGQTVSLQLVLYDSATPPKVVRTQAITDTWANLGLSNLYSLTGTQIQGAIFMYLKGKGFIN